MSDDKLIPFPVRPEQVLTFDQCADVTRARKPVFGIIIGYDPDDDLFIFNFGSISRKDALWISEQMRRHALGEPIS